MQSEFRADIAVERIRESRPQYKYLIIMFLSLLEIFNNIESIGLTEFIAKDWACSRKSDFPVSLE